VGSSLTVAQSGATYQWLDCNNGNQPIPGATGQTFTPSAITGNYAVQITNGSCVNTSDCFAFSTAGITDQTNEFEIALFPNPTQDNLTLIWSNIDLQGIRLTDAAGRLVIEQRVSETDQLELNVSNQSNGVYFLHWTGGQSSGVIKVIKE
jgi:hypothetical protein